jgi:hypothetical protein
LKEGIFFMRYNFKETELLQITDFCCSDCLSYDITEAITQLRKFESVEVYAKAELIEELIGIFHGLVIDGNEVKLGMIDFDGEGLDYGDVYCLTIDDIYHLWCEPAFRLNDETGEWETFNSEATLAYLFDEDFNQEIIEQLEENEVPILLFGFEEE